MFFAHTHYLPIALPFFAAFAFALALLLALIQVRVLRFAYLRLGVSPAAALWLLFASLIGGAINIPIAQLAAEPFARSGEVLFYGMPYVVPEAAVAIMAFICHALARPVHGVGIALPTFAPPLAAALVAALVCWRELAPLAYVGGSLGVLIGADLANLDKLRGLGAPVASIGGAGTFDGIFVTGLFAVLLASLASRDEAAA